MAVTKMTESETIRAKQLIVGLFWEADRISNSGVKALQELAELFKLQQEINLNFDDD